MKHDRVTDNEREQAALFALGALPPEEAQAFEAHLADGCAACRDEVDALTTVVRDGLAYAATPVAPRPEVRTRLLDRARRERTSPPPLPPFAFLGAGEGTWEPRQPGVFRKLLSGESAYLIRLEPGATIERHEHPLTEHCYVLEGSIRVAGRLLGPRDYHVAAAGTVHEGIYSESGCVFLVVKSAGG